MEQSTKSIHHLDWVNSDNGKVLVVTDIMTFFILM